MSQFSSQFSHRFVHLWLSYNYPDVSIVHRTEVDGNNYTINSPTEATALVGLITDESSRLTADGKQRGWLHQVVRTNSSLQRLIYVSLSRDASGRVVQQTYVRHKWCSNLLRLRCDVPLAHPNIWSPFPAHLCSWVTVCTPCTHVGASHSLIMHA